VVPEAARASKLPRRDVLRDAYLNTRSVYDCGNTKELFGRANKPRIARVLRVPCSAVALLITREDMTMTLKHSVTTALLIAALALPVGAFAQTTSVPSPAAPAPHAAAPAATAPAPATHAAVPSTAPAAQATRHMRDDQIRGSKLIGASVYDTTDQKIGTVDELVLNPDGKVADVVIGVGGFLGAGEKRVAVPMAELKRGKNDHFVLAATKDSLKQMANFELKTIGTAGSGSSAHK
jgi:sporulation protein YlmC with PRC-barrel domain